MGVYDNVKNGNDVNMTVTDVKKAEIRGTGLNPLIALAHRS